MNKIVEPESSQIARNEQKGIVVYCDGSSIPNPGWMGNGSHGYIYNLDEIKKPINIDNYIATNKGYIRSHLIKEETPANIITYFDFIESYSSEGTNNKAEILALLNTLKYFKDQEFVSYTIHTDSRYLVDCINKWCYSWNKNNWIKNDGAPVSNKEILKELYNIISSIRTNKIPFHLNWIKAHVGLLGNTEADTLATIGRNLSISKVFKSEFHLETDVKNYWKVNVEKHPFINFKKIYFNTLREYNKKGYYYQADPGGNDFIIGKRIPESGYSVVKLITPEPHIELVKNRQFEISKDINSIVFIKLAKLYHRSVFKYIDKFKGYCLTKNNNNFNLDFTDNDPVTIELNPTGLSLRAIEFFNFLDNMLDRYEFFKANNVFNDAIEIITHNVTDVFYNKEIKIVKKEEVVKTVLKETITNNIDFLNIPVKETHDGVEYSINIPIILGLDIVHRNNLKKLEELSPEVIIVTWKESDDSIRYATIIECSTGIGIWSNFFCDRIFFKLKKKA